MQSKYVLRFIKMLLQVLFISKGAICLRDVYMNIPEAAERGKPMEIKCMYHLENEHLYQVKWYLEQREFCRYEPKNVPQLQIFPIDGIEVHPEATNSNKVTITPTSLRAQGLYTCEVSTDAPDSVTVQMHGEMFVVDLPEDKLEVSGLQDFYKPGMILEMQCVSRNSIPPANLSFYVNGEPVPTQNVLSVVFKGDKHNMWTTYSNMKFVVQSHNFLEGQIKIRCAASIYNIYYETHEQSALQLKVPTTLSPEPDTEGPTQKPPRYRVNNAWSFQVDAGMNVLMALRLIIYLCLNLMVVIL